MSIPDVDSPELDEHKRGYVSSRHRLSSASKWDYRYGRYKLGEYIVCFGMRILVILLPIGVYITMNIDLNLLMARAISR